MLPKAILLVTIIYSTPDGTLEPMTFIDRDFRAMGSECLQYASKRDSELAEVIATDKGVKDDKGREKVAAKAQCTPVSNEDYAIFTSTFMMPSEE